MTTELKRCKTLVRDPVAFPSLSGRSNLPIVEYIEVSELEACLDFLARRPGYAVDPE